MKTETVVIERAAARKLIVVKRKTAIAANMNVNTETTADRRKAVIATNVNANHVVGVKMMIHAVSYA
ncbi:MAG: hypothetical protein RRZ24_03840 [Clostridia bacterium]